MLLFAGLVLQAPSPPPPVFTDVESLTVQTFNLRNALLLEQFNEIQHAQQDLQKEIAAFKTKVEAEHPGWTWNPTTGAWTQTTGTQP